jgi:hypothetical protein
LRYKRSSIQVGNRFLGYVPPSAAVHSFIIVSHRLFTVITTIHLENYDRHHSHHLSSLPS